MEVFKAELQLVVILPFGAPTKLAALQLLNDEPKAFDLRLRLSEVGAFGRERPDHPLPRLHIVWQIGEINVHKPEVYADSRASSPIHMPVSQSAAVIIPPPPVASAALVRANCAEVSISVPPGSMFDGQRNTPCSSRPFRPRNTKRCPEKGSCRRTPWTSMASPSM